MLLNRPADVERDRAALLELHCMVNYESESPRAREVSFADYRAKWLSTPQPAEFISALEESLGDVGAAVAEVWEAEAEVAGFLWVRFARASGYDLLIAEVAEVAVAPAHRRRGLGRRMLERAERLARERGAGVLRSETSVENVASRGLHESCGFGVYRLLFEKWLREDEAEG